jgi:hypothetical protein
MTGPEATAASAFPDCILGPLLGNVLGENGYLPAACITEPDDAARGRLVTELADAAAAQGATVISADPGGAGLSRYAMPEEAAYARFIAIARDPGRECPVLLIAPQDLPAAILRDIRKCKGACVVAASPKYGGWPWGTQPERLSLLWSEGQLTATASGIARLLDVAVAETCDEADALLLGGGPIGDRERRAVILGSMSDLELANELLRVAGYERLYRVLMRLAGRLVCDADAGDYVLVITRTGAVVRGRCSEAGPDWASVDVRGDNQQQLRPSSAPEHL